MNPFVPSDKDLIRRLAKGDESAFDLLYERHRGFVLSVARRYTAQEEDALDVLQDAFSWLIRRADSIDLRAKMTTLLYPVVRHQSIDLARRRRRRKEVHPEGVGNDGDGDYFEQLPAPCEEPGAGSQRADLAAVLKTLSSAHREIVLMRYVDGLENDEIAEVLKIPPGTVKSRLHYALNRLREDPGTRSYFEKKESSNPSAKDDPGEKS